MTRSSGPTGDEVALEESSGEQVPAEVVDGPHAGLNEALTRVTFVDHHVHSVVRGSLDEAAFLPMITESDRASASAAAGWQCQLGIAVRRWCAPLLGAPAHASGARYLEARAALEPHEVTRRLVRSAGVRSLLVDTGFRGDELMDLPELETVTGVPTSTVVRLESVAEDLAREGVGAAAYPDAFRAALQAELPRSVGWKSVLAYRGGLDIDADPPTDAEVVAAAGRWLGEVATTGRARVTDRVLLRFGLWEAVRTGRPIQIHTGFGDTDLDLWRADPTLLTPFLRATEGLCQVILLHGYPFHRQAGYLAQMFGHVSHDIGLAVTHTGIASTRIVAEALELTPLTKLLYSSDAWGLPELHLLGSWLFRRGVARVMGAWVRDGDWSLEDALDAIERIAWRNADRVYALGLAG